MANADPYPPEDSGINWTSYGPEDKGTPYADKYSARGIGAWENEMTVGEDVAMNAAARAKYGIRKYDPADPSTKDQYFTARGQRWHYADNVPEKYSDARVDVFKGRYDNLAATGPTDNTLPPLGGRFDWSGTEGVTRAEAEDQAQYEARMKEAGEHEIAPKKHKSLEEAYREKTGDYKSSTQDVVKKLQSTIAPKMDPVKFSNYATTPDGNIPLKAEMEKTMSAEDKFRLALPKYADWNDDQVDAFLYNDAVKRGTIDKAKVSLDIFKATLHPNRTQGESLANVFDGLRHQAASAYQQWAGEVYTLPKAIDEMEMSLTKFLTGGSVDLSALRADANKQMEQYIPGKNWFKDFVLSGGVTQALAKIGQQQKKDALAESAKANQAKGVTGAGGRFVGEMIGEIPRTMMMLFGGPENTAARVALTGGMEAATNFHENLKFGETQAWIEAAKADIVASGQTWLFNNPIGRIKSGLANVMMGATYDEIDKWSKGEPTSFTDFAFRGSVDMALAFLWGRKKTVKEPSILPQGFEKAEVRGSEGEPQIFTDPVLEETRKGLEAQKNGDYPKATEHVNRAMSLLSEDERAEAAKTIASHFEREKKAPPGTKEPKSQAKTANQELNEKLKIFNNHFYGLGQHEFVRGTEGQEGLGLGMAAEPPQRAQERPLAGGERNDLGNVTFGATEPPSLRQVVPERGGGESPRRPEVSPHQEIASLGGRHVDHSVSGGVDSYEMPEPVKEADIQHIKGARVSQTNPRIIYLPLDESANRGALPKTTEERMRKRRGELGAAYNPVSDIYDWIKSHGEAIKKIPETVREGLGWDPKFHPARTETGMQMADIVKRRTSEARNLKNQLNIDLAQDHQMAKLFKHGDQVTRRRGFFDWKKKEWLKAAISAYEHGKKTGDTTTDQIMSMHEDGYKAMLEVEQGEAKFNYKPEEHYIYRMLKGGQKARDSFAQKYNDAIAADPTFSHARAFKWIDQLHEWGFELQTYNLEDIFQARLRAHERAMKQVRILRDAERIGIAKRAEDIKKIPKEAQKLYSEWKDARAPNGEMYKVEPGSKQVIDNVWDTSSIYHTPFFNNLVWNPLKWSKGTANALLSWSFAHTKHVSKMSLSQALTQMSRRILDKNPEVRGQAFQGLLSDYMKSLQSFGNGPGFQEVDYLQGSRGIKLTGEQLENIRDSEAMGLVFQRSEEMQIQWLDWMARKLNSPQAGAIGQFGAKILTSEPVMRYQFDHVIPRQKWNAAMMARDTLKLKNPELWNPGNEIKKARALTKIGHDIEGRFGEMFYDALLWDKQTKEVGMATLLSMGWQIGAIRTYGGAIRDVSEYAPEIARRLRGEAKSQGFEWVTDRMLFAGWYTALNMLEAGLITYAAQNIVGPMLTGKQTDDPYPHGWDYVFPRVGKLPDGTPERVQPIEYSREVASLIYHIGSHGTFDDPFAYIDGIGDVARNKLQPWLSSSIQAFQNVNYYGREIADTTQHLAWLGRIEYIFENAGIPIPFKQAAQSRPGQQAAPLGSAKFWQNMASVQTLASIMGFPPAPTWTERSGLENKIVEEWHREFGHTKTKEQAEKSDLLNAYRSALESGDSGQIAAAHKAAIDYGITPKSLQALKSHKNITFEAVAFHRLDFKKQAELLSEMSQEERAKYWKYASQKGKKEYLKAHGQ